LGILDGVVRNLQPKQRIGEMLMNANLIEASHLEEALSEQKAKGGKIVEILIDKGYLDIPSFVRFFTKGVGIPGIDILNYDINPAIVNLIPADFARNHEVFPLDKLGNQLTVGMVCPTDSKTVQELETLTNLRVRAFVCNKTDLVAMIRRHYGADEGVRPQTEGLAPSTSPDQIAVSMRARHLVRLIRNIDALPPLPVTAQRCQEAMASPDISVRDLARTIEQDPTIAANLLRVVNSAAFGLSHRVSGIAAAVSFLGMRETYALVLAAIVPKFLQPPDSFDLVTFRQVSLFCAAACKAMAEAKDKSRSACFFTAGLLHDVGRIVLAIVAPQRYSRLRTSFSDQELVVIEETTLGISHPEAGYILARNWGLPTELTSVIRFHANPGAAVEAVDVVETVALSVDLWDCAVVDPEQIGEFVDRNSTRIAEIGLDKEDFISIIHRTKAAIDDAGGANGFLIL
jgi:HD-like signal output (HDOD) protein